MEITMLTAQFLGDVQVIAKYSWKSDGIWFSSMNYPTSVAFYKHHNSESPLNYYQNFPPTLHLYKLVIPLSRCLKPLLE